MRLLNLNKSQTLVGSATCASFAIFLSLVFHDDAIEPFVPILFLAVVSVVGLSFGAAAGILGCIAGGLVFAVLLFEPVGSLAIKDVNERFDLLWMLLCGVAASCLLARFAPHDWSRIFSPRKRQSYRHSKKARVVDQKSATLLAILSVMSLAILWSVLEHPLPIARVRAKAVVLLNMALHTGLLRNLLTLPFLIGICFATVGHASLTVARSKSDGVWHLGKVLSVKKVLNNPTYSVSRNPQIHYYTLFIGVRVSDQAYCAEYMTPIADEIDDVISSRGMDVEIAINGKRLRLRTQNGRKLKAHLVYAKRCVFTTPELHGSQG